MLSFKLCSDKVEQEVEKMSAKHVYGTMLPTLCGVMVQCS
jgi:hypothetical protein